MLWQENERLKKCRMTPISPPAESAVIAMLMVSLRFLRRSATSCRVRSAISTLCRISVADSGFNMKSSPPAS